VLASSQYTSTDQTSTQNGFTALSRMLPVPSGVGPLGGSGGIRYTIDLSAMLNLKAVTGAYLPLPDGRFCGSSGNFGAIKPLLAGFMQAWNSNPLNANKQVDRVLGVVGQGISDGADSSGAICADGMASVVSPEAGCASGRRQPLSTNSGNPVSHRVADGDGWGPTPGAASRTSRIT
jgi:hypothetical protein